LFEIDNALPISAVLDDICGHLRTGDDLVLQAPPGAGKTTIVPLVLMDEPWRVSSNKKILVLEPRRIATRTAAHRMADLLHQQPGGSVGYRMRLDTRIGPDTVIEVITEGILTRMLQQDPSLADVGLVIFDEFHERNMDSDLGLALTLQGRSLFRDETDPLKILIMSATLHSSATSALLDDAPVVSSEGRQYPVDIIYAGARKPRERIVDRTVPVVMRALDENPDSSLLVFLPGQGEIHALAGRLSDQIRLADVHIRPLYGNLSMQEQQLAIAPEPGGQRKVVLATNIAETSLTIDGINVVIDTGLAREPQFDPNTAMSRLQTKQVSASSTTQRAGRAGRLAPGRCYRLWSKDQQQQLAPQQTPEIQNADLAPLALQLLQWGVSQPGELRWLDVPPTGNWLQALQLLDRLGATQTADDGKVSLSAHGNIMMNLSAHPRLAHMLACAAGESTLQAVAVLLAATLSDRDPFGRDTPDMAHRIAVLQGETRCPDQRKGWMYRTRELANQFESQLRRFGAKAAHDSSLSTDDAIGFLIAAAYPDRIARRRHAGGYQLANGRSANLSGAHSLGKSRWLAVAETGGVGNSKGDTIHSAAILDPALFDTLLAGLVRTVTITSWDEKSNRFTAERQQRIGELILERSKIEPDAEMKKAALVALVAKRGLEMLPWTTACRQLQGRVGLLAKQSDDVWPDLSDEHLLATLADWLGPYLDPVTQLSDFKKLDLYALLQSCLNWKQIEAMNKLVPERLAVPSGSNIQIDYSKDPPVLAVKLQEMFGVTETPVVNNGHTRLLVHLLSPAGRPLQVTQDLGGFWQTSYQAVKKEMKGRYPKHPWPDDPLTAIPTRKTKRADNRR
jgi:ATP-dependent helicase HrpB